MAQNPEQNGWRVGVDTGGTFTDVLLADPVGTVRASCKVLSTPDDPGQAVLRGIEKLLDRYETQAGERPTIGRVVHGSTVATNALLESKADAAAFITTAGFEDLLLLARQNRPDLYALAPRRNDPPIPRDRTLGVKERITYDGCILAALTQHEIDRVVDALKQMGVASAVICLLHSYVNDAHERALADAIRTALPALYLTVSSELLPEVREYERAATCAANAVVAPTMARYIGALDQALGENRLSIMASGGGTLPPRAVIERPIETVMSGPAGGVIGAWAMAQQAGEPRVIGFDMGGTSTDVSLCDHGPTRTTETTINGLPIRLPVIDIHTVGAGGGSIAWIDDGGALRVGPQSAGADPGPACYGKQGGTPSIATVTDAHAVLGHLRDGRQLGDALAVDADAARQAVGSIAERLRMPVVETAEGILRIADAAMARAIQRISVQRGHDARDYTLVAFGGAGGLHACRLADLLGMTRVLVPVYGGLLSAFGMLAAPPRYAFSHAVLAQFDCEGGCYTDPLQDAGVQQALGLLHEQGAAALTHDGIRSSSQTLQTALDLRFAGQSYEITVPCEGDQPMIDRFLDEHQRLYGYAPKGKPIELVTARIQALGPVPNAQAGNEAESSFSEPRSGIHIEILGTTCHQSFWNRWDREFLRHDADHHGLAVIEEYAATTMIPGSWKMHVLADGQILIQKKGIRNA
ncbi:MAG: hydantoinase/oxoprolinase family protein [Planctomycetota bacterium]